MASNYGIVMNFCDQVGPFLKFGKKTSHSCQKIAGSVWFHFKTGGFGLKTITAVQ